MPADVLLIGEAPGKAEDLQAEAFYGVSGRLLNQATTDAGELFDCSVPTMYITNVLGCRPMDMKGGPNRKPTETEMIACWPRVNLTYEMVRPKKVVYLGKVAAGFLKKTYPDAITMVHPAYILRIGSTNSSEYRSFVRRFGEIFLSLAGGDNDGSIEEEIRKGQEEISTPLLVRRGRSRKPRRRVKVQTFRRRHH